MRKKIIITAVVVVSLLLLFIAFMEYRQYSSYKTPIHKDADFIVKINADAFVKSFIKEYGFSFSEKIKKAGKKDTTETVNTGIYPSANIFIYTIKGKQASTLFCTIPLSDESDFKLFAEKKMGISFSTKNTATAYDDKLTIACSKEYAAIAFSGQKEEVLSVLTDLLNKKNLLARSDELITKLKSSRNHLVFAMGKQSGSIEIKGNEMLLHATIDDTDSLITPGQTLKRKITPGNDVSFHLAMKPPVSFAKKNFTIKESNIDSDTLLHYLSGYADMTVNGIVNQNDTVITYNYDDNFEKQEQRSAVTVQVPDMEITAKADPGLLNYLRNKNIVTTDQKINRDFFPLYQVSVRQDGPVLMLNTNENSNRKWESEVTPDFLDLNVNLEKLQPVLDSSSVGKYTTGIRNISVSGKKLPGTIQATIDGHIIFKSGVLKTLENIINTFSL